MGWEIERQVLESAGKNTMDLDEMLEHRGKMIKNLQAELEQAGKVCTELNSENTRLREEKDNLQEQCSQLIDKQIQDDYKVENAQRIVKNLNKTLERYETENKALRELLRLWM